MNSLAQRFRPFLSVSQIALCLTIALGLSLFTTGCGQSQATMERDARKVAELETGFWKMMAVSMQK